MFPSVSLKDLKHPWNWTLALISSFCCLKCFFILTVLETWLGIFICITWLKRSCYRVMCLKPTSLSREKVQSRSQMEITIRWFGCSSIKCTVNWIFCYKHTCCYPVMIVFESTDSMKRLLFKIYLNHVPPFNSTCRWGASGWAQSVQVVVFFVRNVDHVRVLFIICVDC